MKLPDRKRNLGLWIVRKEGEAIAKRLKKELGGFIYGPYPTGEGKIQFAKLWNKHSHWVLVMTTGIAVRYLQGLPRNKKEDPAIVVVDEAARFSISLLSGHEGGANALAYDVADLLASIPVITTATESNKSLVIGIGCRKGVSVRQIDLAIRLGLRRCGRRLSDVRELATIDLKRNERGLREWCELHGKSLRVLRKVDLEDRSHALIPSNWVQKNVGLPGVCESCALNATPRGKLILPKTTRDGVAVAVVED